MIRRRSHSSGHDSADTGRYYGEANDKDEAAKRYRKAAGQGIDEAAEALRKLTH